MKTAKITALIVFLLLGFAFLTGSTENHTLDWARSVFNAVTSNNFEISKSFMMSQKDQESLLAFVRKKGDDEKANIRELERMDANEKLKIHEQWFRNFWADLEKQKIKLGEMVEIRETEWRKLLFMNSKTITMQYLIVIAQYAAKQGDKAGVFDLRLKAVKFPVIGWRVYSLTPLGFEEEVDVSTLERYR
jgi:hypothetical protein